MHNLNDIAKQLQEVADQIPIKSEMADVRMSMKNQALHLKTYQENLVQPMTDGTIELRKLAQSFDETLRFNRTNFRDAMIALGEEIENAQSFIKNEGTDFVRGVCFCFFFIFNYLSIILKCFIGCPAAFGELYIRDKYIFVSCGEYNSK